MLARERIIEERESAYLHARLVGQGAFQLHHRSADFVAHARLPAMMGTSSCGRGTAGSCCSSTTSSRGVIAGRSVVMLGSQWTLTTMTVVTDAFWVCLRLASRGGGARNRISRGRLGDPGRLSSPLEARHYAWLVSGSSRIGRTRCTGHGFVVLLPR